MTSIEPVFAAESAPASAASLVVFNREIVSFRVPLLGVSPQERAHRAFIRIRELLDSGGALHVSVQALPRRAAWCCWMALPFSW